MHIQVVTAVLQQIWFLVPTVTGANPENNPQTSLETQETEKQDVLLDAVFIEKGKYSTIDEWLSELNKNNNEQPSLRKLAKRIRFGTGGMLYDFFTEMKSPGSITSSSNTSLDVIKLKRLLKYNPLPPQNPSTDKELTGWKMHILDEVVVEVGKYTTVDEFYFDFVEAHNVEGNANIGKELNENINLRTLAEKVGFDSGGMLYDFFADMEDPKSVMPPELVLDCLKVVKLVNSLQPSPRIASRFWAWFLGGVDIYLWNYGHLKTEVKEMLSEIVKEEDFKGVSELEAKREGGPVPVVEVLYCLEESIFEFFHFQLADSSLQMRTNALVLYCMVTAASLGKIANNFKYLMSAPFENSDFFKLETYDESRHTVLSPDYYDEYWLYIDKKDLDLLKAAINISLFWGAVRRQVLALGFRILNPMINTMNSHKSLNISSYNFTISYNVAGAAEYDVFKFSADGKSKNWGKMLVEAGFSDTSRLSVEVFEPYDGLADHFLKQLEHLKAVRELELLFFWGWSKVLSKEVAELKRGIERMVQNGERENCNLILGTRVVNGNDIKWISEIEPYGIKFSRGLGPSFNWDPVCDSIKEKQWKTMGFKLKEEYAEFMTRLKRVKQEIEEPGWESKEIGEQKWKLERLSLELGTLQPVSLLSLIGDIEEIMPYWRSLFIRGEWRSIPTAYQKNIDYFKKIKYFECTYKNMNLLEPTLEDKLQSTTLNPVGEVDAPSIKELTVYQVVLDKEGAVYLASLPLRKLYLHICPASKEPSLLPIILDLKSKLAKFIKHLTIFYWDPTPEDETAGYDFIRAKEKEGVFISIRYMR